MRFSLNWLRQWVPTGLDAEAVAARLTAAGLEVDELTALGTDLNGVVVGEIVSCEPHPDADRLRVCEVECGGAAPATVVCGAPNARAGLKAPLATVGSVLPGGLKIKPAKLRGVESHGMLCSSPELGLGEDASGLMELPRDVPAGVPLVEALGLPDHVVELDLTPNRADCLSLRGIAREFAAIESLPVHEPEIVPVPPASERAVEIELQAPADCPRYIGRIIEGLDPTAATPAWMVERLERSGVRSRGPVVDVTNYVLLELGQPLHAFDLDRLRGGIRVRRARPGEEIALLDGQTVRPDEDMLLICDHARPVALAGIMGGVDSAVGDETHAILLESAWFNPATIIGRGRRFGLSTDSSHRFERGVDPALQRDAIERASALILEIAGGTPGPVIERSESAELPGAVEIMLRIERVNRLLGTSLTAGQVADLLERLGMQVVRNDDDRLRVRPPTARRDLAVEVDLIEEVARLVGYDELPSRPPGGRLHAAVASEREVAMDRLRHTLHARGYHEVMTWSFVARDELRRLSLEADAQRLENPLSQDMAWLRTSLLPGLLRTAAANLRHQLARVCLFETGHAFSQGREWAERQRLALLIAGTAEPEGWLAERRAFDFYDLKGDLEQLVAAVGHGEGRLGARAEPRPWLHPGQSAELSLGDVPLGHAGQLHPAVAAELGFDVPVFVAELDLERLRARPLPAYRGTPRFPSVRRDLALLAPEDVPAAEIRDVAAAAAGEWLERSVIFDKYAGAGIEPGYKSVAIGLILRHVSRTLTDDEVDSVMLSVVDALKQQCKVRPRGTPDGADEG
jgi:phenylalanyl-tRNA synthetase beta chain